MINQCRRIFLWGTVALSSVFLMGCKEVLLWHPKGVVAADELKLLMVALGLMLIIVVPVIILTAVIGRRYRASNLKAKYQPGFHSAKLEVFWWIVPIIIIAILGTITWKSTHYLDPYKPLDSKKTPLTIEVVSLNWRWLFIYPDQHIATMNFVEFPVGTPINFKITSDAPMNSFMIRQLAGQIYSMAGMQTKLSLMADEKGDYEGQAMAYTGAGYDNMVFTARVVDEDDFNAWINTVKKSANLLNFSSYARLVPDSTDTSVMYFNLGDVNLFNEIMDKYMDPSMKMMTSHS